MAKCTAMKLEGNGQLRNGQFGEACHTYEQVSLQEDREVNASRELGWQVNVATNFVTIVSMIHIGIHEVCICAGGNNARRRASLFSLSFRVHSSVWL